MTNILDRAGIQPRAVNDFLNRIGFGGQSIPKRSPNDYPEFLIEELAFEKTVIGDVESGDFAVDFNETTLSKVRLVGNQMPQVPFTFGGEQRTNKMYYPGEPEPSIQVLGPSETDVTINGQLKDIQNAGDQVGYSQLVRDNIERIRFKGSLCKFQLGDWIRHGYITKTNFEIRRKTRMNYSITLSIVSFESPPTNAKFLERTPITVPLAISAELTRARTNLFIAQSNMPQFPDPSYAEIILNITGRVAQEIAELTGYVDGVFRQAQNIRQSIDRALGLIGVVRNRIREMQVQLGLLDPFESSASVEQKLNQAAYNTFLLSNSVSLNQTLERFKEQFREIVDRLPLQVYLPIQGDTWPKIATKMYGSPDDWRLIAEYNSFDICEPVPIGQRIEIPQRS